MNRRQLIASLAAVGLVGLLALPAAASARWHDDDGYRDYDGHHHYHHRERKGWSHRDVHVRRCEPRHVDRPRLVYQERPRVYDRRDNDLTLIFRRGWD